MGDRIAPEYAHICYTNTLITHMSRSRVNSHQGFFQLFFITKKQIN